MYLATQWEHEPCLFPYSGIHSSMYSSTSLRKSKAGPSGSDHCDSSGVRARPHSEELIVRSQPIVASACIGIPGPTRELAVSTIYAHAEPEQPGVTRDPLRCFVMTTILDDQLYSHSDRLAGRVVLITGEWIVYMVVLVWVAQLIGADQTCH